jgi:DNA repair protein SbcC/Rad50
MQPLTLTLKGFRGIRDGLGLDVLTLDFERLADGAQLIAIAGANGRGKTTLIENCQPYLTMPSRAAMAGPGGFSYYDHVYLPENEKDLTWAHEGRSYRSQVVIRLNGRRRTEAYLHLLDADGRWQPMRLDDGTVSDGKVETYTRCVEAICGSADTFFTSVFSAQGKRQFSTYRNAEIKTLLADLLGQEEIRALGQRANETARLLKTGLLAIRQELSGLQEQRAQVTGGLVRLDGVKDRLVRAAAARQRAETAANAAQTRHARLTAQREQSQATGQRRAQLLVERKALVDGAAQATAALKAQEHREQQRGDRLEQRVAARLTQERARRQVLEQSRRQCLQTLGEAGAVQRACRRAPLAGRVLSMRSARTSACRTRLQALAQIQGAERLVEQKLTGIEREAGKAALKAEELAHRFGLTAEVPCAGMDLQSRCKLLGDAREARSLVPSAKAQITRLAREKIQAQRELASLCLQREALSGASQALNLAEHREALARTRDSRLAVFSAKAEAIDQAHATLARVEQELAVLGLISRPTEECRTPEEQAERRQIVVVCEQIQVQRAQQAQRLQSATGRFDDALAALPAAFDEQGLLAATHALSDARASAKMAEQAHLSAVRDAQNLDALTQQADTLAARRKQVEARIAHIEDELGGWNLFARCMSNDGLIALAIDDAGPTLSALTNDLLLSCYGPRFTVAVHTLLETGKGEQKEGFDIVVHDGDTGESKSMGLMSGGERVIVNEALVRAVALYLAQHSGRRYTSLFSDEADGALDVDRKRMFMAMKREVLRLGGYEREFFISQTPELTAMADAVIDLESWRVDAACASAA